MWTNRLFEHMNRMFEPLGFDDPPPFPKVAAYPLLNVWEDDNHFYVEAPLPGLELDDINVSITEDDQLTITGVRTPCATASDSWLRQECIYGRFSRTITIPAEVNADAVEARYDAGILTLTLPKQEEAKPKRITVKSAEPAALSAADE